MADPRSESVIASGGCENPQYFLDSATGEIIAGRCHATTYYRCKPCADLHVGDSKQIIRSGIAQWIQAGHAVTFVTLTGPGFWLPGVPAVERGTHRFSKAYWALIRGSKKPSKVALAKLRPRAICAHCTKTARIKAKAAGKTARSVSPVIHPPEDPLGGIPIDPDAFDYPAAVWWNWNLGDLFHRTVTYLRRQLGDDLQYLRVIEWSRRGIPHVHLLFNTTISDRRVTRLIESVNASLPDPNQGWGPIHDVQRFRTDTDRAAREIGRLTSYLAKYLAKETGGTITAAAATNLTAGRHFDNLRAAAFRVAKTHARSRPGGPCPHHCGGILYPDQTGRYLTCDTCKTRITNRIPQYGISLGVRTHKLTKSHRWAIEHRQSTRQPQNWIPVWHHSPRRGWEPKPLTYRTMRRQRRRHVIGQQATRPPSGQWTHLRRRPIKPPIQSSIGSAQPNAPPPTPTP
ncbi:MAG: replication initiator [Actinomycetota bacterium]